jgi:hypothetical protein
VEGLEVGYGDKNNDGFLAAADINLPDGRDLQRLEVRLEIGGVGFKVNQSLSDLEL